VSLDDDWNARWGVRGVRPIGHQLRTTAKENWVRFHSLPGSQRYANSDAEYAELLHRHNTVIDELVAESASPDVLAFTCAWSDTEPVVALNDEISTARPGAVWWTSVPPERTDDVWNHIYVESLIWVPGVLDDLIRLAADDVVIDVIIAPADLAWLVAPYDGGFDVIAATPYKRRELRRRHREWLSTHPQGL
jgi:hypothetical protein